MATEVELPINEDNPTSIGVTSSGIIYAGVNRNSKDIKEKKNDHLRIFQIISNGSEKQVISDVASTENPNDDSDKVIMERDESIKQISSFSFFSSVSPDEYQKCTAINSVTNTLVICNSLHGTKGAIFVFSVSPDDPQALPVLRYRTQTNNGEEVNDLDISPDGQFVVYITDSALTVLPAFTNGDSSVGKAEKSSVVSTVAPVFIKNVPSEICQNESVFAKVNFISNDSLAVAINHPKRTGATLAKFNLNIPDPASKPLKSQKQSFCKLSNYHKVISKSSITSLDTFVTVSKEKSVPLSGYAAFATADLSIGVVAFPNFDQVLLEQNAHPFAITKVALSKTTGSLLASVSVANTIAVHKLQDPVTQSLSFQQAKKRKMTILYTILSALLLVATAVLLEMIFQYKVLGDLMQKVSNANNSQNENSKIVLSDHSTQTQIAASVTITSDQYESSVPESLVSTEELQSVLSKWSETDTSVEDESPELNSILGSDQEINDNQESGAGLDIEHPVQSELVFEPDSVSQPVPDPEPIPEPEDSVEEQESHQIHNDEF